MRDDINVCFLCHLLLRLFPTSAPQPSMTPTNPPPATPCTIPPPTTADSDPPATTPAGPPPSRHRLRNILTSFPLSGARALLHRALPVFRHSRPNTNLFTDLPEQHSSQPLVSIHGPTNVEVPALMDNQVCSASIAEYERILYHRLL